MQNPIPNNVFDLAVYQLGKIGITGLYSWAFSPIQFSSKNIPLQSRIYIGYLTGGKTNIAFNGEKINFESLANQLLIFEDIKGEDFVFNGYYIDNRYYNNTEADTVSNFLFDQFGEPLFGTSVRLLSSTYTGPLVRARAYDPDVDKGQADIMPFKVGDNYVIDYNSPITNLDDNATARGLTENHVFADLLDSEGLNYDCTAPIIYDQTLNNNHYIQTTATLQGEFASNGVIHKINNMPVIHRGQHNAYYQSSYKPNDLPLDKCLFYVGSNPNTSATIIGSSSALDFIYISYEGNSASSVNKNVVLSNERINSHPLIYSNRGDFYNLTFDQFLLSTNVNFSFSENNKRIGYEFTYGYGMFSFQEELIYGNTDNTVEKETNINNAFSIY